MKLVLPILLLLTLPVYGCVKAESLSGQKLPGDSAFIISGCGSWIYACTPSKPFKGRFTDSTFNDSTNKFVKFSLYNTQGLLVFESKDKNCGWDGRDMNFNICTPGRYFYVVERTLEGISMPNTGVIWLFIP